MDNKQILIYNKILKENSLKKPKIFIQHRNLNEFKYFMIEKINPTHRLFVYGVLKNNNKKKEISKNYIKVGEIILVTTALFGNVNLFYENIDFISLIFAMFSLSIFIFYLFGNINILRSLYDNWNRRISWRRKNYLYGPCSED